MRLPGRNVWVMILLLIGWSAFLIWGLQEEEVSPEPSPPLVHELIGAAETCVACHGLSEGFSPSHQPALIGCSPCHRGDPRASEKELAHQQMIPIPGNLSDVHQTCGAANCHQGIAQRVDHSLMVSMSGVVGVNRFVFGEVDDPTGAFHIANIGDSPADTHLRHLCASCHLGNQKKVPGPISELSRGGGCNACHLNYSPAATQALLSHREAASAALPAHPALTVNVSNDHCFGCHSRSSRISLNYEGWHETSLTPAEMAANNPQYRRLEDDRIVAFIQSDIHYQTGLECIDCHHVNEIMGDGHSYTHKEEALRVQCDDCHQKNFPHTRSYSDLDTESKKLLALRGMDGQGKRFLPTATDLSLYNAWVDRLGQAYLQGKNSGNIYPLTPPAAICTRQGGHERLSCGACHTGWAPQCIGCHNTFEPSSNGTDLLTQQPTQGRWVEHVGLFLHDQPTLGVVASPQRVDEEYVEQIRTFIPGMTLTIDVDSFYGTDQPGIFHRLYAPTSAHTTQAVGRSCTSCHNDPLALGYGRGQLIYQTDNGQGRWTFRSEYAALPEDGLPQDAWIGFLEEPQAGSTARSYTRPFSLAEQQRMLTVGACLTCHQEKEPMLQEGITDFEAILARRSIKCILPVWEEQQ